jgi:hypothetical protein
MLKKTSYMQREQMLEQINTILNSLSDKALDDLLTFLKDIIGPQNNA